MTAPKTEEEILSLRRELERRATLLLAYEQEIDDLTRAVAELSELKQSLRNEPQDYEPERKVREEQDAALAHTTAELERLRQSRSVRLTASIRRLASLLRRR